MVTMSCERFDHQLFGGNLSVRPITFGLGTQECGLYCGRIPFFWTRVGWCVGREGVTRFQTGNQLCVLKGYLLQISDQKFTGPLEVSVWGNSIPSLSPQVAGPRSAGGGGVGSGSLIWSRYIVLVRKITQDLCPEIPFIWFAILQQSKQRNADILIILYMESKLDESWLILFKPAPRWVRKWIQILISGLGSNSCW